jgi:hypothetical protein
MPKEETPKSDQTPFDKFTEAARNIFALPKDKVAKVIAATPAPKPKPRKSNKKN